MDMIINQIDEIGFIPTVSFKNVNEAIKVAEVLNRNNIKIIEIMLRSDSALKSIEKIRKAYPEFLIGAGTIKNEEDIDSAIKYGANFIVLPMIDVELIKYCLDKEILVVPGTSSPSEILIAKKLGIKTVKFFPAEPLGGALAIDMISKAFPEMYFIPTGGITLNNFKDYLKLDKVIAVGGGFMLDKVALNNGDYDLVEAMLKSVMKYQFNFDIKHLKINNKANDDNHKSNSHFRKVLDFRSSEDPNIETDFLVEFISLTDKKSKGELVISSDDIWRSYKYLERNGIEFEDAYSKNEANKNLESLYTKDSYGGFKIQIVSKEQK